MKVTLTRVTTDPVMAVEEAAAQCYQSAPSPSGRIMRHCYESGHASVLEHVNFTWHIEGVSRALLAQLTRHRTGVAFSVMSQRYCSMEDARFVTPPSLANNSKALAIYRDALVNTREAYRQLQKLAPNEDARFILPNACETTLQCTMNLREFAHFCNERLCNRAQWEIRQMCQAMVASVNEETERGFAYMLVPKCEVHAECPFCTESESYGCGMYPTLKEIYRKYEEATQ